MLRVSDATVYKKTTEEEIKKTTTKNRRRNCDWHCSSKIKGIIHYLSMCHEVLSDIQ
jgi:hypothetical protein